MEKYKFLISKKTPFRYVFSITINVFLWDCMGKGAYIKRMAAVRNYSTNTIMEKTIKGKGRVKDTEFSVNITGTLWVALLVLPTSNM